MTDTAKTTAPKPGRTTEQMQQAPRCAVFVWPVGRSVDYARALARHLGRGDLQIVGPDGLEGLRYQRQQAVVVDHACDLHLTERQWRIVELLRETVHAR